MSSVATQRLLTIREAAEFLGRGVNTLYLDCRAGRIPHYKFGNAIRFNMDELRAWLETQRRGPNVSEP